MATRNLIRTLTIFGKKQTPHSGFFSQHSPIIITNNVTGRKICSMNQYRMASSQLSTRKNRESSKLAIENAYKSFIEQSENNKNEVLLQPFNYTYLVTRKNIMPEFLEAMNHWMELSSEEMELIKQIEYMSHEAYNLLDDVLDESDLRRGYPTAHKIFGSDRAIIASLTTYLSIIKKLHVMNKHKAVEMVYNRLINMYSFMAEHIQCNKSHNCPTREEYMKLSFGKVADFYGLNIDVMQSFSKCQKDFSRFGALFGLYIQIQNDTVNMSLDEFINDKDFAEDITSGILTFPLVLVTESKSLEADIVMNILRKKPAEIEMKKYCVSIVEKLGALKESREVELDLYDLVMKEIEKLGGNPEMVKILNRIDEMKADETFPTHPLENKDE